MLCSQYSGKMVEIKENSMQCWQGHGATELLPAAGRSSDGKVTLKTAWPFFKQVKYIPSLCSSNCTYRYLPQRKVTSVHTMTCIQGLSAASFIIVVAWFTILSACEGINNVWHMYTVEFCCLIKWMKYYTNVNLNESKSNCAKWKKPEKGERWWGGGTMTLKDSIYVNLGNETHE